MVPAYDFRAGGVAGNPSFGRRRRPMGDNRADPALVGNHHLGTFDGLFQLSQFVDRHPAGLLRGRRDAGQVGGVARAIGCCVPGRAAQHRPIGQTAGFL